MLLFFYRLLQRYNFKLYESCLDENIKKKLWKRIETIEGKLQQKGG